MKVVILFSLLLTGCPNKTVDVFEDSLCTRYYLRRDTSFNICWVSSSESSFIIPCEIVDQCLKNKDKYELSK